MRKIKIVSVMELTYDIPDSVPDTHLAMKEYLGTKVDSDSSKTTSMVVTYPDGTQEEIAGTPLKGRN